MKSRCNDPHNRQFKDYGGRGIRVCARWRNFENFYADMGDPPDGFTLERRDNSRGYSPSNCYWASREEQLRNRRNTIWLEHADVRDTLAGWAQRLGVSYSCLLHRVTAGWTPAETLTVPFDDPMRVRSERWGTAVTIRGETMTISEAARRHGLQPNTLSKRLRDGWSLERALTASPWQRRSAP